jgi:hypothetical protein
LTIVDMDPCTNLKFMGRKPPDDHSSMSSVWHRQ